jgi:hypothetical protein
VIRLFGCEIITITRLWNCVFTAQTHTRWTYAIVNVYLIDTHTTTTLATVNSALVHVDLAIGTGEAFLALATQLTCRLNDTTIAIILTETCRARWLNEITTNTMAQTLVK